MPYSLFTCLAFSSLLLFNLCYSFKPRYWNSAWSSSWGSGSSTGYGSNSPPNYPGSPTGYNSYSSPNYPGSLPNFRSDSPPAYGLGGYDWNSPFTYGSGSPPQYSWNSPPNYPGSPTGYGWNSPPNYPGSPSGYGSYSPPNYPGSPSGDGSYSPPNYQGSPPGDDSNSPPNYPGSPSGDGSYSPPNNQGSPPSGGSYSPPNYQGSPPSGGSGSDSGWTPGLATWYGEPLGAGSDGGSCGYEKAVESSPYNSLIAAGSPSIYQDGKGCGTCYEIKCTLSQCSGQPVTVTITDSCVGCDHPFDLSGTAMRKMAKPGQEQQLQNVGRVDLQYRKVKCNFGGVNVAFRVDPGSNDQYFAVAIEYENGDDLTGVEIKGTGTNVDWLQMSRSWGAVWKVDHAPSPPFSFRLTDSSKTVVAANVIPQDFQIQTYTSNVNF